MNKNRKKLLIVWLKEQSKLVKHWLYLSTLIGIIGILITILQSWLLADLLYILIIEYIPSRTNLTNKFIFLILLFCLRACINFCRDKVGFITGSILRKRIRSQMLDKIELLGAFGIHSKPIGSWSSMLLEQIEEMHDFYAYYLPQIYSSILIPFTIFIVIFFVNWICGLILLLTAPMIPLFMVMIGSKSSEANRRNFFALAKLSGFFLDKIRGIETLRLFFRAAEEIKNINYITEEFRQRTMEVLKLAFLSSGVLEFFASISIAIIAVYFGFSYLGVINFGNYNNNITLFSGFLILMLAGEFFQPLRNLGILYHAKAQAIGAAESLLCFLEKSNNEKIIGNKILTTTNLVNLTAHNLYIMSINGNKITGPLNFSIMSGQKIAIIGINGVGKSSLLKVLLGLFPYKGSILVNGIELRELSLCLWRERLSWVSDNPGLPGATLRENIILGAPKANEDQLMQAINDAYVNEFLDILPNGLDSPINEDANKLSAGQVQRIALARAFIRNPSLLLLDEPTASLDIHSEQLIIKALKNTINRQTTLLVTHKTHLIKYFDTIWIMSANSLEQKQLKK